MPALKLKDKDGNWIPLPTIKGADGKSAYQQAVAGGYKGTEAEFQAALVSLKDGPFLPKSGGTMTGDLHMYGQQITGLSGIFGTSGAKLNIAGESGVTISGGLYLNEQQIHSVGTPGNDNDAANKGYVDSKTLVFSGKTIATTAWVSNSTYSAQGYAYRASVACSGVTTSHRPDVAFSTADAVGGNFAPVADSYGGGVYIYCKTKPTATVTIPSIVCVKGA